LKPQHEAERRCDHRQREGPDQDVIRPRFHISKYSETWVPLRRRRWTRHYLMFARDPI
jgi:hypothetical protein